MTEPITFGRPFALSRDRDLSGVSGTGIIADGIAFPDGHAAIHWRGRWPLTTPHPDGIDSIMAIHDHGGQGDLHVLWADEVAAARREGLADIVEAFGVPPEICGTEAERAHWRRQAILALRRQLVQDERTPDDDEAWGVVELADAVMPIIAKVLEQRDRVMVTVRRASALADRWEAAHGLSMFLVRAAGAELRDELDVSVSPDGDVAHLGEKEQSGPLIGVGESGLECACGGPVEWLAHPDEPGWIHSPGSDTTCINARPRCPECQLPHVLVPGQPPMCRSLREHQAGAEELPEPTSERDRAELASALGGDRAADVIAYTLHTWGRTLADVQAMSDEQLLTIPGIGKTSIATIRNYIGIPGDMDDVRRHYAGADAQPCTKHVGREERQWYGCNGPDPAEADTDPRTRGQRWANAFLHRGPGYDIGTNDRQACPYCPGAPQFLRSELGAHVQVKHARVLAVLASGGSLDEQLADPETRCRLPHEMEA